MNRMRLWILGCAAAFFLASVGAAEDSVDWIFESPSITPKQKELPANFLKFYLTFPQPMERGNVFQYLSLLQIGADGKESEVLEPFREIELWDESFTTLTLWLHPGRQKAGVNLNLELGPILKEGQRYALQVSEEWNYESGEKRKELFRHEFVVRAPDFTQPIPADWTVRVVSETCVQVETLDCLDEFSLRKRVALLDPFGKEVDVGIVSSEKQFFLSCPFQERGWVPGKYRLVVDPRLEDIAGNSVARPFALDLSETPDFVETNTPVEINFSIPPLLKTP